MMSNTRLKDWNMKTMLIILCWLAAQTAAGGNRIFTERVRSLTSVVNGEWLARPVMLLGSDDVLTIGFDELSTSYRRLTYHLEHCEADWTTSEGVFESDWLAGFNDLQIENYQQSINTTVPYTHYELTIPNDRCRLTMSGNYRLTVTDDDEQERLLQVEFYVVEPVANVGLRVTTNTDIDHNRSHQQLSMTVALGGLRVTAPDEQLLTVVMQNWREQTARRGVAPTYVTDRELTWEHCRPFIFDSGNECHKFEVLDVSHPTMGIERIEWDGERYQAYPYVATERPNYLTDVDADGAFCIRNSDRRESDYTCDYVWVNFQLKAPYEGPLYIDGHWTTDDDDSHYLMAYDETDGMYRQTLMLKQGYYSYRLTKPDGSTPHSEGSYYQTQNRYEALVYYRPDGGRTWRLVGYRELDFR